MKNKLILIGQYIYSAGITVIIELHNNTEEVY